MNVLIVFGGVSVEHEISILSAMQVMAAMDEKYHKIPLYIAKNGVMYSGDALFDLDAYQDLEVLCASLQAVTLLRKDQHHYLQPLKRKRWSKEIQVDFVFPVLHGTNGEDGSFQGYLKTLDIPYVGCSVLGGALGQDKVAMKMILQDRGLPVTPWFYWTSAQHLNTYFYQKAQRLGYPLIVKPANLGSSIGIVVVNDGDELEIAMKEAFTYDQKVVIEKVIPNLRELNCAVLGDEEHRRASVVEEVIKQDAILSFQDKYEGNAKCKGMESTSRIVPAQIDVDSIEEITQYAIDTFTFLQASGVSRIDFLMNGETKDLYVNEINTIPGSLAFYLWEKSGLSFPSLIDELILLAKDRYRKEKKRIFTYPTNVLQHNVAGSKGIKL